MALYAILSDDKLSVRDIRAIPDGTQFKLGYVFPVVYASKPVFDPDLSFLTEVWNLPVNDTVTVSYVVTDLPQTIKDGKAKLKKLRDLYTLADPLEIKRLAGTATAAESRTLGEIGWQIADLMRKQFIEMLKS